MKTNNSNVTNIKTKQGLNESEKIIVRTVFDDMCKWLKEMNKYSAKSHDVGHDTKTGKEIDDVKDFFDYQNNEKLFNAWFTYSSSKKSNRYSIYIDETSELIGKLRFSFSRHQFDNRYGGRERTSAWLVTNLFKKALGEKNITDFIHNEVDITQQLGWIDYS